MPPETCTHCEKRPAADGRRWCEQCLEYHRQRRQRRRAKNPPTCRRCHEREATAANNNLCSLCNADREAEKAAKAAKEARRAAALASPGTAEARRPRRPDDAEEDQGKALDAALLRELRVIDPQRVATALAARREISRLCDLPENPSLDADIRLLSRLLAPVGQET